MMAAVTTPKTARKNAQPARPKTAGKNAQPARPARNSVRIIGGVWRGRRIEFPDVAGLRPTPDRIRETLFNWLQHAVAGARCLDLFAGSGALGLEALSRGAKELAFVEQAVPAARALRVQLTRLGAGSRAHVFEMGAARFLRNTGEPFDIVFLDPPFGSQALAEYVPQLDAGNWVKAGGLVYLENERGAGAPVLPPHWELLKSKSAGEVGYHLARAAARSIR
jgi:16S rRNA (guanine966-N2)-methyltransferase